MKTPQLLLNPTHRGRQRGLRRVLVATTVASIVPMASWAIAAGPKGTLPKRLPMVTSPAAESDQGNHSKWTTAGVDLARSADNNGPSRRIARATPVTATLAATRAVAKTPATSELQSAPDPLPARWLRSTSSSSSAEVARRLLAEASREFAVGAWLSAEATTWDALRWSAEAVDLAKRESAPASGDAFHSAVENLQFAKQAIREARDFFGTYGSLDAAAITRMATSHATNLLDNESTEGLSATDASDRYLDGARVALAPIAAQSVEAAQAMDLLAAIYLSRAESATLPSATALALRRAALQGQPGNASLASRLGMHLADVGLFDEARWALEHSLAIEVDPQTSEALVKVLRRTGHGQDAARLIASMQDRQHVDLLTKADPTQPAQPQATRPKIPEITELSPADFAALSKSVIPVSAPTTTLRTSVGNAPPQRVQAASVKTNVVRVSTSPNTSQETSTPDSAALGSNAEVNPDEKTGVMKRVVDAFRWKW